MANVDIFRRVLTDGGLPQHVVDAAIANFLWESGGNQSGDIEVGNQTGDNGASWGAAQWQGSRRTALMTFAAQQGLPWTDPEVQARFVLHELNTTETDARDALMASTDAPGALRAWTNKFERAGTPHMGGRLDVLAGITGTSTTASGRAIQPVVRAQQWAQNVVDRATSRAEQRNAGGTPVLSRFRADRAARQTGGTPILDRLRTRLHDAGRTDTRILDSLIRGIQESRQREVAPAPPPSQQARPVNPARSVVTADLPPVDGQDLWSTPAYSDNPGVRPDGARRVATSLAGPSILPPQTSSRQFVPQVSPLASQTPNPSSLEILQQAQVASRPSGPYAAAPERVGPFGPPGPQVSAPGGPQMAQLIAALRRSPV